MKPWHWALGLGGLVTLLLVTKKASASVNITERASALLSMTNEEARAVMSEMTDLDRARLNLEMQRIENERKRGYASDVDTIAYLRRSGVGDTLVAEYATLEPVVVLEQIASKLSQADRLSPVQVSQLQAFKSLLLQLKLKALRQPAPDPTWVQDMVIAKQLKKDL